MMTSTHHPLRESSSDWWVDIRIISTSVVVAPWVISTVSLLVVILFKEYST